MRILTGRAPLAPVPSLPWIFTRIPGVRGVWILLSFLTVFPQCCLCVMLSDTHLWHWGPADLQGWPSSPQIPSQLQPLQRTGTALLTWIEEKTPNFLPWTGPQDLTGKYFKQAAFSPNLPHLRAKLMSLGVQQSHLCISFFCSFRWKLLRDGRGALMSGRSRHRHLFSCIVSSFSDHPTQLPTAWKRTAKPLQKMSAKNPFDTHLLLTTFGLKTLRNYFTPLGIYWTTWRHFFSLYLFFFLKPDCILLVAQRISCMGYSINKTYYSSVTNAVSFSEVP